MSPASVSVKFTYYAFCNLADALLADLTPDCSYEPDDTFRGMAQMVHNTVRKPEHPGLHSKEKLMEIQRNLGNALERSLEKHSLGHASFELDSLHMDPMSQLRPDLGVLFSESSAHIDLYRNNHRFLSYAEAHASQTLAHQDAFEKLAANPVFGGKEPQKFKAVLQLFDLLAEEGPFDYWQLCILFRSEVP